MNINDGVLRHREMGKNEHEAFLYVAVVHGPGRAAGNALPPR